MISKELLSEVLNREIGEVHINGNEVAIYPREGIARSLINIYELAHKCKEWVHTKGYWMDSCFTGQIKLYEAGATYPFKTLHSEITEPEAIFKACQWIFENKENV